MTQGGETRDVIGEPGWQLAAEKGTQRANQDYLFGLDLRDTQLFLRSFHPDATWSLDENVYTGHAQFEAVLAEQWANVRTTMHVGGDHVVEFVSETEATGHGHVKGSGVTAEGRAFMLSAYYPSDRFECRDGVWRFTNRSVVLTMLTLLPEDSNVTIFGPDATRQP